MKNFPLYPLKFDPIYQYRLWGGRRLETLLSKPLPKNEPVGEAWILSDRDDNPSKVLNGGLKGSTITELMQQYPEEIMGRLSPYFKRFPLLLKFLDCKEVLSVQVHPSDDQKKYIPKGDTGKTEAWVVLQTGEDARIYAGLEPGTTKESLKKAIDEHHVADKLHHFIPKPGDGVFIHSGTVHTLGGAVVFEVQENSDVTFRLYDWDRTDAKTGKPRDLQVAEALDCIDFKQVDIGPVQPVKVENDPHKEKLFDNDHFILWRTQSDEQFKVGASGEPRIIVCADGTGEVVYGDKNYPLLKGDVMLLPAGIGKCSYKPNTKVTLFEIGIPAKLITQ